MARARARAQRYEGRDLAVTTDFRDVFGEIVVRHLGLTDADADLPGLSRQIERFPGCSRRAFGLVHWQLRPSSLEVADQGVLQWRRCNG